MEMEGCLVAWCLHSSWVCSFSESAGGRRGIIRAVSSPSVSDRLGEKNSLDTHCKIVIAHLVVHWDNKGALLEMMEGR